MSSRSMKKRRLKMKTGEYGDIHDPPRRIGVDQLCRAEGCMDEDALLEVAAGYESDTGCMPALCEEGCWAEPDGQCPHGHPSVLLELGMM